MFYLWSSKVGLLFVIVLQIYALSTCLSPRIIKITSIGIVTILTIQCHPFSFVYSLVSSSVGMRLVIQARQLYFFHRMTPWHGAVVNIRDLCRP